MSDRKSAVIPTAVAVIAALLVVAMVAAPALTSRSGGDEERTSASGSPAPRDEAGGAEDDAWEELARREPGDPMAMGDVDAPVVLISYSDFQCPFCGKFARDTEPRLIEQYVESGTLRIEWKDFPYLGPESRTAALAGRAAAAQGRFWEFHDAMYAEQLPPNSGRLTAAYVTGIAEELGLDIGRFRADMRGAAADRAVHGDFAEGQAIGVTGTPTFVVNGVPIVGAQPVEAFQRTIEAAAAGAGP